mgnify:FL=1
MVNCCTNKIKNIKTHSARLPALCALLSVLLCVIPALFISCASHKTAYVKPDFTDEQVFNKELERIRDKKKEKPVYALWRAALLIEECRTAPFLNRAETLFKECAAHTEEAFYDAFKNENWAQAARLGKSLQTVYAATSFPFENAGSFAADCAAAQDKFSGLARLSPREKVSEQKQTEAAANTVRDFIQGCVTVWVDLGVKVQKGMGFASRVIGSGFFIDERGYIVTNHHVIADLVDPTYEGYGKLYIKLASDPDTRIPARVIGWDKTLDLALLKTEIKPPYVFTLGSSENLSVGERIYAIGSPAGLESTITSGIVSSFDRNLLSTVSVIQIDAAVNSGNSGGPLVNAEGEVQGVVFAGLLNYQGLNFAVPVEYLKTVLNRLYASGETKHAWIGAYGRTYKKNPSDTEGQGVQILYAAPGGSADYAGLRANDIVTAVNGKAVRSIEELQQYLIGCAPLSLARVSYRRPLLKKASGTARDSVAAADSTQYSDGNVLVYCDERPEYPGKYIYERESEYRMFYPLFGMELVPASVGNKRRFSVQSIIKGSSADESGFSVHDPVEILKTRLFEEDRALYAELYTKKRKSGYLEVGLALYAPLDSLYFF